VASVNAEAITITTVQPGGYDSPYGGYAFGYTTL